MPTSNTRHKSAVVMLIIDVINHFECPDGAQLLKQAVRIAPKIARLKARPSSDLKVLRVRVVPAVLNGFDFVDTGEIVDVGSSQKEIGRSLAR
jgi:hypothetical protein